MLPFNKHFSKHNEKYMPRYNIDTFLSKENIQLIIESLKKDFENKFITQGSNLLGPCIDNTNKQIETLISEYKKKYFEKQINSFKTLSCEEFSKWSSNPLPYVIEKIEIPYDKIKNEKETYVTGKLKIILIKETHSKKTILKSKTRDVIFNDTKSKYNPLKTKLTFDANENTDKNIISITITVETLHGIETLTFEIPVKYKKRGFISIINYMNITNFITNETINMNRNCGIISIEDIIEKDIFNNTSGNLYSTDSGNLFKKNKKSSSIIISWCKYAEVNE